MKALRPFEQREVKRVENQYNFGDQPYCSGSNYDVSISVNKHNITGLPDSPIYITEDFGPQSSIIVLKPHIFCALPGLLERFNKIAPVYFEDNKNSEGCMRLGFDIGKETVSIALEYQNYNKPSSYMFVEYEGYHFSFPAERCDDFIGILNDFHQRELDNF